MNVVAATGNFHQYEEENGEHTIVGLLLVPFAAAVFVGLVVHHVDCSSPLLDDQQHHL